MVYGPMIIFEIFSDLKWILKMTSKLKSDLINFAGWSLSALGFPTVEILRIYFLQTIVPRCVKIYNVGLFSCDKFEETPKQKVITLLKFLKIYFSF